MASALIRRPLPALIALLALLLLTALVWWRVLNRDSGKADASKHCTTSSAGPTITKLPEPASVTFVMLNGTAKSSKPKPRTGIAGKALTALTNDGFRTPGEAVDDKHHKVTGIADIRYGPTGARGAKLLEYYLPGATLVPTKTKTATVTISLGFKYKRVATKAEVAKALTKNHATSAPSTPGIAPSASSSAANC